MSRPAAPPHPSTTRYRPRDPTRTALYQLVAEQHATFAEVAQDAGGLPSFVESSFERYLRCGVLAHGFARFHCGDCGLDHLVALSFVQRYGGGLNLNVHLHLLGLDGWFHRLPDGHLTFERAPAPTQREVEALVLSVHARVMRLLERNGLLDVDADDPLAQDTLGLSACYDGAVTQRVALGPARGRPVMKLGQSLQHHLASAPDRLTRGGLLCAQVDGFDLHGRVAFGPTQRARIEQLVRYCARPPLAHDRLSKLPDGHYLLRLKTQWRDGTTHLRFEPIELMERLAAQIPKPRINLVLYAGVLAPNAKLRAEVVQHGRPEPPPSEPATETLTRAERETWSELMRATFDLDMLACPRCGSRLRHIATILDRASAQKILEHLGLPARAPPPDRPRRPPPFWLDEDAV